MSDTAIFDLDRTITREPTWTRFLIFANRGRPVFWLHLVRILAQGALYKLGLASRDSVKVISLRALAHLSHEEAKAASAAFIAREMVSGLRPGAVAAIRWHAARGDRLIIATASVDLVADELARALGFHEVIATRLDWSGERRQSGPRLASANCYGEEKMRRIEAHGITRSSYAYSDHVSDLPMLLNSDHGIAVNPSSGLRKAARKFGLQVLDFNTTGPAIPTKEVNAPA
jgi:phosphatidylglycerophosphatase C